MAEKVGDIFVELGVDEKPLLKGLAVGEGAVRSYGQSWQIKFDQGKKVSEEVGGVLGRVGATAVATGGGFESMTGNVRTAALTMSALNQVLVSGQSGMRMLMQAAMRIGGPIAIAVATVMAFWKAWEIGGTIGKKIGGWITPIEEGLKTISKNAHAARLGMEAFAATNLEKLAEKLSAIEERFGIIQQRLDRASAVKGELREARVESIKSMIRAEEEGMLFPDKEALGKKLEAVDLIANVERMESKMTDLSRERGQNIEAKAAARKGWEEAKEAQALAPVGDKAAAKLVEEKRAVWNQLEFESSQFEDRFATLKTQREVNRASMSGFQVPATIGTEPLGEQNKTLEEMLKALYELIGVTRETGSVVYE